MGSFITSIYPIHNYAMGPPLNFFEPHLNSLNLA